MGSIPVRVIKKLPISGLGVFLCNPSEESNSTGRPQAATDSPVGCLFVRGSERIRNVCRARLLLIPVRGIEQHGPSADGNRQPSGLSVRARVRENQECLQGETTVDTRPRNRTARAVRRRQQTAQWAVCSCAGPSKSGMSAGRDYFYVIVFYLPYGCDPEYPPVLQPARRLLRR